MREIDQSTAANVMVLMVDSTDHVTGKTGLTLTITASKDGGAFASISPTVTERGSGWYNVALTASHTDTIGDLALHITGTAADPSDFKVLVKTAEAKDATVSKPGIAQTISSNADITAILGRVDVATSTRSAPGTAQTITAPADMALNSTVAKEATLTTKIPTALSFTGANVNAESKATAAPADMALNSTVAKETTLGNLPTLAQIEASTVLAQVADIPTVHKWLYPLTLPKAQAQVRIRLSLLLLNLQSMAHLTHRLLQSLAGQESDNAEWYWSTSDQLAPLP